MKNLFNSGREPFMPKRFFADGRKRDLRQIPKRGESLADKFPEIAAEFICASDPKERASNLTPWDYKPQQGSKAWFKCRKCGTTWETSIHNRTSHKSGCPRCGLINNKWSTSYQEQYIKNVLQCVFPDLQEQVRIPGTRMSVDMYIPSAKLVIEYGQSYQHTEDRKQDAYKRAYCKDKGIKILFIIQDADVSARNSGQFYDGAIRIPNRNKSDQKKFIDPVLDRICKACGKEYELAMVDRDMCSRKALEDQKRIRRW